MFKMIVVKGGESMITYAVLTNKGKREKNEDYIGVKENEGAYCFVLADGLGGHGRGEVASQLVVEETMRIFHKTKDFNNFLEKAFSTSQNCLLKHQVVEKAINEMKTTEVILAISEETIQWGHIGDSRLYHFKGNHRIVERTLDHSVPQMLASSGEIKEKQIRNHPDRNRVLRVMGTDWTSPKYEVAKPIKNRKKHSFLLCSDGFWELINEKDMVAFLKKAETPEEWLENMEKVIWENGKEVNMDNFSAIAVWVR